MNTALSKVVPALRAARVGAAGPRAVFRGARALAVRKTPKRHVHATGAPADHISHQTAVRNGDSGLTPPPGRLEREHAPPAPHAGEDPYSTRGTAVELRPRAHPVRARDRRLLAEGPLAAHQVDHFTERGFLVLPGVFDASEAGVLGDAADDLKSWAEASAAKTGGLVSEDSNIALEGGAGAVRSVFAVHKGSRPESAAEAGAVRERAAELGLAGSRATGLFNPEDLIAAALHDPRVVSAASQLLGSDVYIHQSRVNFQPAFTGTGFYWHSDFETWHAEDGLPLPNALSAVVLLDSNESFNGALMVVPGSHDTFVACAGETPEAFWEKSLVQQDYGVPSRDALKRLFDEAAAKDEHGRGIQYCTGQAGDVILFDCNLMHGSHSNISPKSRKNAFAVYNSVHNAPKAPYYAPTPRPEHVATRDAAWQRPINTPR